MEDVIDTISKGAAQSWQMENRYKTMNEGEYIMDLRWTGCGRIWIARRSTIQWSAPSGNRSGGSVLF